MDASYVPYQEGSLSPDNRRSDWDLAIGLQKVDGLTPSKYLHEVKEENISGKTSYVEVEDKLLAYYAAHSEVTIEERQCDLVSTRIAKLLSAPDFSLHPAFLRAIHGVLFQGIYLSNGLGRDHPFAGIWRTVAITKSEPILGGASVSYGSPYAIVDMLDYDFAKERGKRYTQMTEMQKIQSLAQFCSDIWQVHPFMEGNTRATAVFMEKYLRATGWDVNNDFFKDNAAYFRNALVLANYSNMREGISENPNYINAFFSKLLFDKDAKLPILRPSFARSVSMQYATPSLDIDQLLKLEDEPEL